jgi:hypothetical protein
VGEESKLVRSFERLRSIVRKKRQGREKTENERNMRLEEMVREVMTRHAAEKYYNASAVHETVIGQTVDHRCHVELVQDRSQPEEGVNYTAAGHVAEDNRLSPTFPRVVNSIVSGELEERKYSVSCHEALNRHAEDKRYSLVLPKSVVGTAQQESQNDEHCSSDQDVMRKEPSSDQEDSMLRPLVDKQVSLSTQQTESKGQSATHCHHTTLCRLPLTVATPLCVPSVVLRHDCLHCSYLAPFVIATRHWAAVKTADPSATVW